jgi:hypothetical protein
MVSQVRLRNACILADGLTPLHSPFPSNIAKTQVGDIKKQQNTPLLIQVTYSMKDPNISSSVTVSYLCPSDRSSSLVCALKHRLIDQHNLTSLPFTQPELLLLLLQGLSNAVEVACGAAFNLALCGDGTVYSWGVGALTDTDTRSTSLLFFVFPLNCIDLPSD